MIGPLMMTPYAAWNAPHSALAMSAMQMWTKMATDMMTVQMQMMQSMMLPPGAVKPFDQADMAPIKPPLTSPAATNAGEVI